MTACLSFPLAFILVPRGHAPFGQQPLGGSYFFKATFKAEIERSQFLALTKKTAVSGDENDKHLVLRKFYDIFARACAQINKKKHEIYVWPTLLGFSGVFFLAFPFLLLSFYYSCCSSSKIAKKKTTTETRNFYVGVAEYFSQISKHCRSYFRLNWPNHSDLGVIEKSFPPAELSISDAIIG